MTNDRLTLAQVVVLGTYSVGMAGGQVLFKLAAQSFPASAASVREQLTSLAANTYFFVAFAFYCALATCWVWILTFTPLSRAYPFVALAFAITPILGGWLFDEPMTLRLAFGIAAIVLGPWPLCTGRARLSANCRRAKPRCLNTAAPRGCPSANGPRGCPSANDPHGCPIASDPTGPARWNRSHLRGRR